MYPFFVVIIFLLEDFSLFLVKIDHFLLTSDPEHSNKISFGSLSCSLSKQQLPHDRARKTYLNLSMASTAPCLCSSNFGGGGSFPSPPPFFPFSLPPFFFFPGIATLSVWRLLRYLVSPHPDKEEPTYRGKNPSKCACAIHSHHVKSQGSIEENGGRPISRTWWPYHEKTRF